MSDKNNRSPDEIEIEQPESLRRLTVPTREFKGPGKHLIDLGLALIPVLVIYWTVNITSDFVIKRSLYLMITLVLCAIIYPFSKKSSPFKISMVDMVIILLSILGSLYVMYDYNSRFMRLGEPTTMDMVFGVIMLVIGLDIGRRAIGWALTLVSLGLLAYGYFGNYIPGHFGHGGFLLSTMVGHIFCGMEGYYGMATKFMTRYIVPFILLGAFLEK
ncbi:MAG: hypothetical protein JRJ85_05690, partial [Deltaproteobacteria bacterium]|nr:hypothetical protein [Deltaproteobacteria bacterium]